MRFNGVRIAILGTAALTMPAMLQAQTPGQMGAGSPANQQNPNQTPTQQPGMNNQADGGGPGMGGQNMMDKMFLRKAAEGGMAEVQLGQLAAQKGGSDDVKQFGQKMVDDHTKLNEQMMPIAEQMGVHAPKKLNKKDQAEYDKLNSMSGDAFDKEYLSCMVKDHHMDLREFRREMNSTQDPTLKTAVSQGEQVIQQHATLVDSLAQKNGVTVPKQDQDATMK